jgi:RNA binding exosome subunit
MDRTQALEELDKLKKTMNLEDDLEFLKDITPKISKLSDLISRLDKQSSWENHLIQKENGDYRIFHKLVNYKKENEIEYRIGIYVTES